ncbi:ubiquitin-conjugating enzyme family protein [Anaeramoeba flamelloides]|uniref:Ubiquitin-conjugating enzyme family protein n=1 Tax=Anaeramoeba flamelloides TaxID=1746091 RepID=A0AAV7Z8T9_9EUKA|nr:ubiquitin-conjugating enzyme family protein [Anaeramoeba flamelloides]KAJ6240108.1 ubiquitin-conjugating enzyme family protein [Anaeramoeba flamelloides]
MSNSGSGSDSYSKSFSDSSSYTDSNTDTEDWGDEEVGQEDEAYYDDDDNLFEGNEIESSTNKLDPMQDELSKKATNSATKTMVKEFRALQQLDESQGIEVGLVNDDLYLWDLRLKNFDKKEGLHKDLMRTSDKCIHLRVKFPQDFPFSPPYIRVIRPRFQFRTGHVTLGGAICSELLTKSGWSPAYTMESVIVTLRAGFDEGSARLDLSNKSDYDEFQARQAYERFARNHGWKI